MAGDNKTRAPVVFITGAARGFGLAFADSFGGDGASVAMVDLDDDELDRSAARLRERGIDVAAVRCDVTDEVAVDTAVQETVDRFGALDVLINNAGLHLTKYNQPFGTLARADVRQLFEVNVMGVINCTVAAAEPMRHAGGGAVVNISSIAGYDCIYPYGVSKLAVRGLTMAFAQELASDNIRVNAVAPGLIASESALADLPQTLVDDLVQRRQLVHRLGAVDDIVRAVRYLCSESASFITGETLKVSGGYPLSI